MDNNKIDEAALTKRVKTLVLQERYEEALKAFEDIDIGKIKNISILCLAGEVYMGLQRYDDAENILLRVYEKNANTRRILDLLTTLYIDKGEYSEAEYYYKEFIAVASRDLHRYILRYRLDKGKGERLSVLIDTLEKLKDYEYIEEWAYELATLYDASGDTKKCIHECDEIALWFGHGEYVDKAIALKCKLTGQPLPEISTVEQHQLDEEREEAEARENMESVAADMGIEGFAGADYEGSIDVDLIERALNNSQSGAVDTAEETVSGTEEETENATEAVTEVSVSDDAEESETASEDTSEADAEEEKSHIAHLFSSLMFGKSKAKKDHFDWSAMNTKSTEEQNSEMDILAKEIAEEENTDSVESDMYVSEDTASESEMFEEEDIPEVATISTEGFSAEDAAFFESLMGTGSSKSDFVKAESDEKTEAESEEEPEEESEGMEISVKDIEAGMIEMPEDEDTESEIVEDEDVTEVSEHIDDNDMAEDEQVIIQGMDISVAEDDEDEIIEDHDDGDDEDEIIEMMEADQDIMDALKNTDSDDEDDDEDEISDDILASDTVLDIFGSVTEVKSIKEQLAKTFTKFEDPELDHMDLLAPYDINFVVTGEDMSVKSQIAIGIAKALNTYGICDKNKLVRATADDLNGREFASIFNKLKGGCLIIEQAGMLNEGAAKTIADFVQKENQDVAIVLEGEEERLRELFIKYPVLHRKFLNVIHIGKYNENELVQLAEGYAKNKGYELAKPAAEALKTLLKTRMEDGYSVNYEDIMAIIEEAISSLEKRNMKNLFMTVLDNKYEEAAMFLLQPVDFDNINIPD